MLTLRSQWKCLHSSVIGRPGLSVTRTALCFRLCKLVGGMNGEGMMKNSTDQQPLATTKQGQLRGVSLTSRSGRVYSGFLGVPFAEPPKRFEMAKPPESWTGIRDATEYGPRCIQKDSISKKVWGSEDCLYLNVFTPDVPAGPTELHPVLVFIYGGAFLMGSGDEYDPRYIMDKDVIVVTFNYRVGIFGFLNTEDGLAEENLGLKDQVLALQWVQENIEHFGGDKTKVTLMGQSAGAACVHYHILSPMSKGLFSAAILHSGSALCPWGFQRHPLIFVKKLAEQLNGPTDDNQKMIEFFKSVEAGALAAGDYDYKNWKSRLPIIFSPSQEVPRNGKTMFLSDTPWNILSSGKFARLPMIIGMTSHEGLNRAGPVLRSESLLKRFNENWDTMAPLNLLYRTLDVDVMEMNRKIREFYFHSQPITSAVKESVIDLFSDRYFFHGILRTSRIHAAVNGNEFPVYMYMFDFLSEISMLHVHDIHEIMGVGHSDDLQYLFDTTLFPKGLRSGTDYEEMSKNIVHLWTDFVTHRTVTTSRVGSSYEPWLPLTISSPQEETRIEYYLLNLGGKMATESEGMDKRMKFWDYLLPFNNQ